MFFEVIYITI